MNDLIERLKNLKTTIFGIVTAIIAILVGFGIVTSEEQQDLMTHTDALWTGALSVMSAVSGIILLFSKDK